MGGLERLRLWRRLVVLTGWGRSIRGEIPPMIVSLRLNLEISRWLSLRDRVVGALRESLRDGRTV